mmetsp:Transcript_8413/g.13022  ORF Transcript_8413/g.13022 Transcript_8413/m.13022 type:complete len:485 (+) Transcript_8413:49-1503(+)
MLFHHTSNRQRADKRRVEDKYDYEEAMEDILWGDDWLVQWAHQQQRPSQQQQQQATAEPMTKRKTLQRSDHGWIKLLKNVSVVQDSTSTVVPTNAGQTTEESTEHNLSTRSAILREDSPIPSEEDRSLLGDNDNVDAFEADLDAFFETFNKECDSLLQDIREEHKEKPKRERSPNGRSFEADLEAMIHTFDKECDMFLAELRQPEIMINEIDDNMSQTHSVSSLALVEQNNSAAIIHHASQTEISFQEPRDSTVVISKSESLSSFLITDPNGKDDFEPIPQEKTLKEEDFAMMNITNTISQSPSSLVHNQIQIEIEPDLASGQSSYLDSNGQFALSKNLDQEMIPPIESNESNSVIVDLIGTIKKQNDESSALVGKVEFNEDSLPLENNNSYYDDRLCSLKQRCENLEVENWALVKETVDWMNATRQANEAEKAAAITEVSLELLELKKRARECIWRIIRDVVQRKRTLQMQDWQIYARQFQFL